MAGIGTVIAYWSDDLPAADEGETWAFCDGSEVKRTDYAELYELVGDVFGAGDNVTTFNLPDLRGRFIRGLDWGPDPKEPEGPLVSSGRDPGIHERASMGDGTVPEGPTAGSLQPCALEEHQHPLTGVLGLAFDPWGMSYECFRPAIDDNPWGMTAEAGGLETRPVNAYANYIIRLA